MGMAGNYGTNTLDAVTNALVAAGVGQISDDTADWFISQGYMPDGPKNVDRILAIYLTPGEPPLQRWAIDYPGVQVVGRGSEPDYALVIEKLFDCFQALHEQEAAIDAGVTGSQFVYFYGKQSAPLSMGRDEMKRPKQFWNFRTMRNRPQP